MDKAFQVFTVFSYNVCIVKTDLPMVASNESVRLYSYMHFSSVPISSFLPACCSGPQPSKLAFMLSTSHLLYCMLLAGNSEWWLYWATDLTQVLTLRRNTVKKVKTAARMAAKRSQEPGCIDILRLKLGSEKNMKM